MAASRASSDDLRVLNVKAGAMRLSIPAADVSEVFKAPRVTRVPNAPPSLFGVANLRGEVVPVVSLGGMLGQDKLAMTSRSRVVLLEDDKIGLIVDEVTSLSTQTVTGSLDAGRFSVDGDHTLRVVDLRALIKSQFGDAARRAAKPVGRGKPAPSQAAVQEIALLGFTLADQVYALRVEHVSEVIALPAHLASLPRTDAISLGVTLLRDGLLPLVLLRALLGLEVNSIDIKSQRVVVAKIGDSLIGLVVDKLTVVLRAVQTSISPVPTVLNRGPGEARIESIFRLRDGKGLVAILSPERLFEDDRLAQIIADGHRKGVDMTAESEHAALEQFVVFRLGDEEYGLPIAAIDEIVRLPDALTRVPRAPAFIEGAMNLHGKIVPIIDQRARFAVEGEDFVGRRRVIVTTVGDLQAGFIVDSVSEVLTLSPEQLQPTPDLRSDGSRVFNRIAKLDVDGRMVLLIDPSELLDRAERDLLNAVAKTQSGSPTS